MKRTFLLVLCLSAMFLTACDDQDKELVQSEIDRANQKVEQMNLAETVTYAPALTQEATTALQEAKQFASQQQYMEAKPKVEAFHSSADKAIEKAIKAKAEAEELARIQAEEAAKKAAVPTYHVVKRGDWLSKIGREQSPKMEWKELYKANKDTIKDPNVIFPGQKVQIPAVK